MPAPSATPAAGATQTVNTAPAAVATPPSNVTPAPNPAPSAAIAPPPAAANSATGSANVPTNSAQDSSFGERVAQRAAGRQLGCSPQWSLGRLCSGYALGLCAVSRSLCRKIESVAEADRALDFASNEFVIMKG